MNQASFFTIKGGSGKKRREQIFWIMERLQYQPSVIASAIMGKKTYTPGLLIPDISNPFFSEIARAIEDQAHQAGYSVIICSTDNKEANFRGHVSVPAIRCILRCLWYCWPKRCQ